MSLIIKAKELLKKAKELNDPELIDIAMSMIDAEVPQGKKSNEVLVDDVPEVEIKQKRKKGRPKKVPIDKVDSTPQVANKPLEGQKEFDFTMDRHKKEGAIIIDGKNYGRKEPIKVGKNKFVDDLTEVTEEIGQTPSINKTPRERPHFKMLKVKCCSCSQVREVHPIDVRNVDEYFCTSCRKLEPRK